MFQFKIWLEDFENPSDFFSDPANNNLTMDELMDKFKKAGGRVAGNGSIGTVIDHPSWPYVAKFFPNDPHYLQFARYAYKNPHPGLPKLFGAPVKIVPNFSRQSSYLYVARIERLEELPENIKKTINDSLNFSPGFIMDYRQGKHERTEQRGRKEVRTHENILRLLEEIPQALNVFDAFYEIAYKANLQGALDYNKNNIMKRNDQEYVLIDPLWAGSNPYADHQAAMDMATDRWGNEEWDEKSWRDSLIPGGKPVKPKKRKRKPKAKPYESPGDDDVPF